MKDINPTMEASNVEKGVFSVHVTTYNVGTDIVVDVSTPAGGDTLVVSRRKISAAAFAEAYSEGVDLVKECKLVCVRELFDAILISSTEDMNVRECAANGDGHYFEEQSIPSEYHTGVEGGAPLVVTQCKYCGEKHANSN